MLPNMDVDQWVMRLKGAGDMFDGKTKYNSRLGTQLNRTRFARESGRARKPAQRSNRHEVPNTVLRWGWVLGADSGARAQAYVGENATGHEVLRNFDMAVANSGGSIVLGGLVENLSLAQIFDLFENEQRTQGHLLAQQVVGGPCSAQASWIRSQVRQRGKVAGTA